MKWMEELFEFNWHHIGAWSIQKQFFVLGIGILFIIIIWYQVFIVEKLKLLGNLQHSIIASEQEFKNTYEKSVYLEAYKNQIATMDKVMKQFLKELPPKNCLPEWLSEIAQLATLVGVELRVIKPEAMVDKEFYMEFPLELSLVGTYPKLARFLQDMALMKRIITTHDLSLKFYDGGGVKTFKECGNALVLKIKIKIYSTEGI